MGFIEKPRIIRARTVSFAILFAALVGGLAALLLLVLVVRREVPLADPADRPGLVKLAWMAAGLAGFTLVVLIWSVMRYYRFWRTVGRPRKMTPRLDAWAEAGRRFQLKPDRNGPTGEQDGSGPTSSP